MRPGSNAPSRKTRKTAKKRPSKTAPLSLADFVQIAHSELRRIAGSYFQNERPHHTLQPTALVHEVFVRLSFYGPETYGSRAQFFAAASRAMRQILVEYARARNTDKRGGRFLKVPLDTVDVPAPSCPDYLAIDSALAHLEAKHSRSAEIASMRIFAGLSVEEVAEALGLASSTVREHWNFARLWLQNQLQNS